MSNDWIQEAIDQLDELLTVADELRGRAQYEDLSDLPDEERQVLAGRLQAAMDRLTLPGTAYRRDAEAARSLHNTWRLLNLIAVAKALREDLARGWVQTVTELVHAGTFASLLDRASELHSNGYKDAAAVIAGTALEVHLRDLATKHAVTSRSSKGGHKKADTINSELRKAGTYGALHQKQVTAWLGIRNAAAHGEYGDYDSEDVRGLIRDVEQFITRFPA